jgi:hypothetical protein
MICQGMKKKRGFSCIIKNIRLITKGLRFSFI